MADIQLYIPILKQLEGGYVCDSNDLGGATNHGVTLKVFQTFFGNDKTADDLRNITDEQLTTIIKNYWDSVSASNILSQQLANQIADWCYNSGAVSAANHVQQVLGIEPTTGYIGTITIGRINSSDAPTLNDALVDARIKFYQAIVANNPSQEVFLKGWINRANFFRYKIPA
jgi:lysozyme family protein